MVYAEDTPFYQLLATKHVAGREAEAIGILKRHPEIARLEWPGPEDAEGRPFIKGSTAMHYAANDGRVKLMRRLVACGGDVNASRASWFRSVLSWAANNARLDSIRFLLKHGARPDSLDAVHAAAWGGAARGKGRQREYVAALKLLIEAGADLNDRRNGNRRTPLAAALASGNTGAIKFLRSLGAVED